MSKYFTKITENELKNDLFQQPIAYVVKPFASYQEIAWELGNIVVSPCKCLLLTVTTLLEALVSIGYACYFYRSLYALSKEYYINGQHAADIGVKMLGVFIFSLLHTLVVLCRLVSTVFSVLLNPCGSSLLIRTKEDNESISNSIQRYRDFIRQAGSDRRAISSAISEYHSEVGVLNKYLQVELDAIENRSDRSIKSITCFRREKPQNSNVSHSTYSELLAVYHELIVAYPIGEFEDWTTSEDISRITLALVEAAHADYEEHHQKVLDAAQELLGDLDATVRPVRNYVVKKDERVKQIDLRR